MQLLTLLIEYGVHLDKADTQGFNGVTPLDIARFQGHSDVVRLLLENGAEDNSNRALPDSLSPDMKVKLIKILEFYRTFVGD